MKSSALANHERHLRQEMVKKNKIALDFLRDAVYLEMKPIVLALIERAKSGDYKTAEMLFDRAFGKVKESLEVDVKFSLSSLAAQWEEQQKAKQESDTASALELLQEPSETPDQPIPPVFTENSSEATTEPSSPTSA